jgi:hypothetical protein
MERPKIDFPRVKREVLVVDVARRYGVELRGRDAWLHGRCPLPTHESKDSRSSFAVNLAENYWLCHSDSCKKNRRNKGGGDVITLVALKENCQPYEAAQKLIEWFHVNGNEKPARAEQSAGAGVSTSQPSESPAENKPLGFPGFKEVDSTHEYLRGRGIRLTTLEEFGVGFYSGRSTVIKDPYRIVIPVHNAKGELVAYAGRSLDPTADKYHFPAGFHKSLELFNLHRVRTDQPLLVIEGFFGCMAVHQAGFQNVVALMGRTLSDAQLKLLERFTDVVLMLDGDEPGREATAAMLPRIAAQSFVRTLALPDGEQPDTIPPERLKDLLTPALV